MKSIEKGRDFHEDQVEKINTALDLNRQVTGVKFLFDKDEFKEADAGQLTARMPYCVMVKRAMRGHSIKAVLDDFACRSSARTLGLFPPEPRFTSGLHYNSLGLYKDLTVSKNIRQNMTLCSHQAYGVMVKPLASHAAPCDVVLIVCRPYQAMRLVQAYTYHHGYHTVFRTAGNQALCSECTAHPFEYNTINLSMLCSGTRFMAGWQDDEMALGIAYNKLESIVDGLYATLNPIEPDQKKKIIQTRLVRQKKDHPKIEYGKNYYTGLYLTQDRTEPTS